VRKKGRAGELHNQADECLRPGKNGTERAAKTQKKKRVWAGKKRRANRGREDQTKPKHVPRVDLKKPVERRPWERGREDWGAENDESVTEKRLTAGKGRRPIHGRR